MHAPAHDKNKGAKTGRMQPERVEIVDLDSPAYRGIGSAEMRKNPRAFEPKVRTESDDFYKGQDVEFNARLVEMALAKEYQISPDHGLIAWWPDQEKPTVSAFRYLALSDEGTPEIYFDVRTVIGNVNRSLDNALKSHRHTVSLLSVANPSLRSVIFVVAQTEKIERYIDEHIGSTAYHLSDALITRTRIDRALRDERLPIIFIPLALLVEKAEEEAGLL